MAAGDDGHQTLREAVIYKLVEAARRNNDENEIDTEQAARIASQLYDEAADQDRIPPETKFADEIFEARRDGLIFFRLVEFRWGRAIRLKSGAVKAIDCPLSEDQRLGYPSSYRIWNASRRVYKTCPDEARTYRRAYRAWQEARLRYLATESESFWLEYHRKVAYHTKTARMRRGGVEHFRRRRLFRYMSHELFARERERQRALTEMREADVELQVNREKIFDSLGVPNIKKLRRL